MRSSSTTRSATLPACPTCAWRWIRPSPTASRAGRRSSHPILRRETFQPGTDHGGYDGDSRSLRYLEWTWDPDPSDDTFITDFAYLLRDEAGEVGVKSDRHVLGLFSRSQWLETIAAVGFLPQAVPYPLNEIAVGTPEVFVGVKPAL